MTYSSREPGSRRNHSTAVCDGKGSRESATNEHRQGMGKRSPLSSPVQGGLVHSCLRKDQISPRKHDARNRRKNAGWVLSPPDRGDHPGDANRALSVSTSQNRLHTQSQWKNEKIRHTLHTR